MNNEKPFLKWTVQNFMVNMFDKRSEEDKKGDLKTQVLKFIENLNRIKLELSGFPHIFIA